MRRLIVGDIHGCLTEFSELVDQASLGTGDEIIALGDLVDRGPDSPRVLEIFRTRPNARALCGNHERKHIRSFRHELAPARSQRIARLQFGEAAYPAAVGFMATLPIYLDLPEALLIHGQWEPGLPLEQQRDTVLLGTMSGQAHLQHRYPKPWYTLYDGPKPIVVGHLDYSGKREPFVYGDRVFGLDTSCCLGGALTGLLLPEFRFISVPSHANHWRATRAAFPEAPKPAPLPKYRAADWNDAGNALLAELLALIEAQHAKIMATLQEQPGFDTLNQRDQGKAYAELAINSPFAWLLFAARQAPLTLEKMRETFRNPARAQALLKRFASHTSAHR